MKANGILCILALFGLILAGSCNGETREDEKDISAPDATPKEQPRSTVHALGVGGGSAGAYGARGGIALEMKSLSEADELLVIEEGYFGPPATTAPSRGRRMARYELQDLDAGEDKNQGPKPLVPHDFQASQGSLLARDNEGETLGDFPLKHTDVKAEVSGFLASTVVRQTFANPYKDVIEAVYVFPLPSTAAINDFLMQIGERKIRGIIRPREEAERIYQEARARGQTASLLTQERPNIFTQNVANIEPGGEVIIHITYFHTLAYEKGTYEYLFPMVVGPRYMPGAPTAPKGGDTAKVGGEGTAPDTDQVPDASKISPPVLREGERSGHDISVLVDIDAGVPLGKVEVPTHDVHVEKAGDTRTIVRLSEADSIPNRDFLVRYRVSGEAPAVGMLTHRGESGGFFTLMLVPQLDPRDADVTPREVTFVMDTSGSMGGVPMAMSREVVKRTLTSLRPDDRFNIIRFAGDTGMLSPTPLPNSEENVEKGLAYIGDMRGSGGTEMLKGIRAYLETPKDSAYIRIVCFLTDGYVGNEQEIIRVIKEEGQDARWFAFGIGSSVNRYLISGIGTHGNGGSQYVLPREGDHAEKAVSTFFGRIDAPVLVDIAVDYGDLPITDVYPKKINDLFTGLPIVLKGRYTGPAEGTINVIGRVGDRAVTIPVEVVLPEKEERNAALGPVWARQRISDLSSDLVSDPQNDEIVQSITNLALEFRLVSKYTSFVAVDESRIVGDGKPIKVLVPVEIPEDVSRAGAVGTEPVGIPVRAGGWGMTLVEYADASVRVAVLDSKSPAEAQVKVGDRLVTLNRTQIRGIRHLESLLLQTTEAQFEVGFRPAAEPQGAVFQVMMPQP